VVDLGDGRKRVTSAEGGYEFVVPASWFVAPGGFGAPNPPNFGQVHVSSFDPKAAPTLDPARWMLPPSVGVMFDIQLWHVAQPKPLDQYVSNIILGPDTVARVGVGYTTIGGQAAYRFTMQNEHRFQRQDGTLVVTRQTEPVWIIATPRPDRVLVVFATPAENDHISVVDQAVAEMRIYTPFESRRPVTYQRDEILQKWSTSLTGKPVGERRVEAKLVPYDQALAVQPSGAAVAIYRLDHDPSELYWIVAVSGDDLPQGRGGPLGSPATPPPTRWILYDTPATTDNLAGTFSQIAAQGSWPPTFDALPDLCR